MTMISACILILLNLTMILTQLSLNFEKGHFLENAFARSPKGAIAIHYALEMFIFMQMTEGS